MTKGSDLLKMSFFVLFLDFSIHEQSYNLPIFRFSFCVCQTRPVNSERAPKRKISLELRNIAWDRAVWSMMILHMFELRYQVTTQKCNLRLQIFEQFSRILKLALSANINFPYVVLSFFYAGWCLLVVISCEMCEDISNTWEGASIQINFGCMRDTLKIR